MYAFLNYLITYSSKLFNYLIWFKKNSVLTIKRYIYLYNSVIPKEFTPKMISELQRKSGKYYIQHGKLYQTKKNRPVL